MLQYIGYTLFKVIMNYWLYSLCCKVCLCSLFILYIVMRTSKSLLCLAPSHFLSPLVSTHLFSICESFFLYHYFHPFVLALDSICQGIIYSIYLSLSDLID